MIEYYCDGSYKEEEQTVGCGIIRKKEDEIEIFSYVTKEENWFGSHEVFAIYQTLLLVEEKQEKDVIIFNDGKRVLEAIYYKSFWNEKISNNILQRVDPLFIKLKKLRKKGYNIRLKYKKDKNSNFMRMAHKLSRSYLSDKKIEFNIKKEEQIEKKNSQPLEKKKKQTIIEYLASVGIYYEEEQKKKSKQPEKLMQSTVAEILNNADNSKRIDTKILLNSKNILFKKISKKKWCVLNEKEEPIYINQNLVKIIHDVSNVILKHKQTVHIQESSKHLFESVTKSKNTQMQYPELFVRMKKWEKENRIEFVS